MSRLTLLCLVALATSAGAEPQPNSRRNANASKASATAGAPIDPYAAPAKPLRSSAKANDSSPVDPYAISSSAAQAAYSIASRHIVELRNEAIQLITARLTARQPVTEYEVMLVIMRGMAARGIVGPSPTVVAGVNTANAHYVPTAQRTSAIQIGDPIVIFVAGKIDRPEGILASQTWCAVADKTVPAPIAHAFETIRRARDRAIAAVANRGRSRRASADQQPEPSFTVGQGIYFAGSFGLRSEVSLYLGSPKPERMSPAQTEVQTLLR